MSLRIRDIRNADDLLHRLRRRRALRLLRGLPALCAVLAVLLASPAGHAQQTEERPRENGTVNSSSTDGARQEELPAAEDNGGVNTAEATANGSAEPSQADPPAEDAAAEPDGDPNVADEDDDGLDLAPRRPLFNRDELLQSLPDFGGQLTEDPGFIPDTSAEDLFERRPGTTPRERYSSLLGNSKLPEGRVRDVIGIQSAQPGRDLGENFARVLVPDGTIEGSTQTKQFKIRGGVIIFYNDVEITAEEADIDEKNETAVLRNTVEIVDPTYTLKTDEIRIFFGDKRFQALGFVQFQKNAKEGATEPNMNLDNKARLTEYLGGQRFELFCNRLDYDWGSKDLVALDAVRLAHSDFNGTMERLEYNDRDKAYGMYGDVILDVARYDWIFRNRIVDSADESKVRAITDAPTQITASKVLYSDETALAQFYAQNGGQVKFDQRGKRGVTANYIEINDTTKDFYAEGSESQPAVFNQTDGQWLFDGGLISRDSASDDLKATLEKPLTAKANTIVYNFDRKRLEMRDNVSIVGETQSLTAGELVQDETEKFFLVRNNVTVTPEGGSSITAAQLFVDTSTNTFTFVGLVRGKMHDAEQAAEANAAAAELAAQSGTGGQQQGRRGLFESSPQRAE